VSYDNFFLGSVTVSGALTGLLFVALSVAKGACGGDGLGGAIARSWELRGLRGGGLLDFLVTRAGVVQAGAAGWPATSQPLRT
jgi:hypothetical protein